MKDYDIQRYDIKLSADNMSLMVTKNKNSGSWVKASDVMALIKHLQGKYRQDMEGNKLLMIELYEKMFDEGMYP